MKKLAILMCVVSTIMFVAGCSTTYKMNPPSSTTTTNTTTSPAYATPTSSTTTTYN
jgi:outer membrane murein-binding lipoprotein Lpp